MCCRTRTHTKRGVTRIGLGGQCDKLAVDRRKYCQLRLTTVQFIAPTDHLYPAELTTRCDDVHAVAKFSNSRVWGKLLEGNTLILADAQISLQHGRIAQICFHTKSSSMRIHPV